MIARFRSPWRARRHAEDARTILRLRRNGFATSTWAFVPMWAATITVRRSGVLRWEVVAHSGRQT